MLNKRTLLVTSLALGLVAIGAPQIKEAIKIIGVGAAVRQFGPDMDKALDRMTNHTDSSSDYTKVVPIITIGLNSRGAIGAAQVKGARKNVDKVKAVASPQTELFGKEILIRAMIPVDRDDITKMGDVKAVQGVGVSGIIDLKL